jgi:hypothetical protein
LEEVHNLSRPPKVASARRTSWDIAMQGYASARDVLTEGGALACTFTATSRNVQEIENLAKFFFEDLGGDEFHITPVKVMGDTDPETALSDNDFRVMWESAARAQAAYNRPERKRVWLNLESVGQLRQLRRIFGNDALTQAFSIDDPNLLVATDGHLMFAVEGVKTSYHIMSLYPLVGYYVGPDAYLRTAFASSFPLLELMSNGPEVRSRNLRQLDGTESLPSLWELIVSHWRKFFWDFHFNEEREFFRER